MTTEPEAIPAVDELAQEIRRVDGSNSLGAGALAEALMLFFTRASRAPVNGVEPVAYMHPTGAIWRLDNCPDGIDFSKDGWIPLGVLPTPGTHPAPASPDAEMVRMLREARDDLDNWVRILAVSVDDDGSKDDTNKLIARIDAALAKIGGDHDR